MLKNYYSQDTLNGKNPLRVIVFLDNLPFKKI